MLVSNKICTCYTHGLDMFVDYVLGDDLRDFGTFGCFWTIWDDVFVRVALGDIHNQIHPELHPTLVWLPHRYYSLNFTSSWLGGRLEYMSIQSVRCPWNFMVKLNDNNHTFARYFDSVVDSWSIYLKNLVEGWYGILKRILFYAMSHISLGRYW